LDIPEAIIRGECSQCLPSLAACGVAMICVDWLVQEGRRANCNSAKACVILIDLYFDGITRVY
jgi:hypothetical protein